MLDRPRVQPGSQQGAHGIRQKGHGFTFFHEASGTGGAAFLFGIRAVGNHYDGQIGAVRAQFPNQLSAVHVCHAMVGNQQVSADFADMLQGIGAIGQRGDARIGKGFFQRTLDEIQRVEVVIHNRETALAAFKIGIH